MEPKKDNKILYIMMGAIAYVFLIFLSLHVGTIMNETGEDNIFAAFIAAFLRLEQAPFDIRFYPNTIKICLIGTAIFVVVVFYIIVEAEKNARTMPGKENGSAKWMTAKDIKKYNQKFTDEKNPGNNIILSKEMALSLNSYKTRRNLNTIVLGGSGSGKSRFFIKPNILQANTSYVITDPSGELVTSTGKFLESQGYKIKVFNLVDMAHSNSYNPFNYIRDDLGVITMVNCLIKNTTPPGRGGGDPFWEKSETALLEALIFYLREYAPPEQQNFTSVMKLLRAAEVDENNLNKKSDLDRLFDQVKAKDPKSIALKQYLTFKMGSGKTLKSILISCSVRLTIFNMKEIEALTGVDDIDLGSIGKEKQALFVVLPQADDSYNFLASLMYSQLYETLYFQAENEWPYSYVIKNGNEIVESVVKISGSDTDGKGAYNAKEKAEELLKSLKKVKLQENDGKYYIEYDYFNVKTRKNELKRKDFPNKDYAKYYMDLISDAKIEKGAPRLPSHVRFLLDEFANIGQIPEFDKKMATMRKYEISSAVVLQNLAQLREIYDKKTEAIVGNADTMLFLGSPEPDTCKYISEKLGSATIVVRNNSRSRGGRGSSSLSFNRSERKLLDPAEVSKMDDSECIVFVRGQQPYRGPKFEYTDHKNYEFTGDNDINNRYSIKENIFNKERKVDRTRHLKAEQIKEIKAQENREKTSEITEPENLLKTLKINDPKDIPKVLAGYSKNEPEINIKRANITKTNISEEKTGKSSKGNSIETWDFTPIE